MVVLVSIGNQGIPVRDIPERARSPRVSMYHLRHSVSDQNSNEESVVVILISIGDGHSSVGR